MLGGMIELWCDDCGARWREQCRCPDQPLYPELDEQWVGIDGHSYRGDPKRASLALHDPRCRACRSGEL